MKKAVAVIALLFGLLAASVCMAGENKQTKEPWTGTIQVTGRHTKAELAKMARVSMADAEKSALASIEAQETDKRVKERELEVEHGYLIYSFDIKIAGKKGISEILVDAGNGKVLAHEHE